MCMHTHTQARARECHELRISSPNVLRCGVVMIVMSIQFIFTQGIHIVFFLSWSVYFIITFSFNDTIKKMGVCRNSGQVFNMFIRTASLVYVRTRARTHEFQVVYVCSRCPTAVTSNKYNSSAMKFAVLQWLFWRDFCIKSLERTNMMTSSGIKTKTFVCFY